MSSPVDVLRKHCSAVQDIVSDPERLADHLYSKDLISYEVKDEILTTLGLSRLKKARIIMNEVQRNLMTGDQVLQFSILCETLKEIDSTDVMNKIVREMERDIESIIADDD